MSFWLVISISIGALFGILLALRVSPAWLAFGVILTSTLVLPGLLRPQLALLAYRAWNKLARYLVRVLRLLLMGLCFYTVFLAVRCRKRRRSSLKLASSTPNESMWVSRGTLRPESYASPYLAETGHSSRSGWIANFISSITNSGEFWAFSLLPFLILLSVLQTDDEQTNFPTNIYTLF
jgi:hypothetical protein